MEETLASRYSSTIDEREALGKHSVAGFGGSASTHQSRGVTKGSKLLTSVHRVGADGPRPTVPLDLSSGMRGELGILSKIGALRLLASSSQHACPLPCSEESHEGKTNGINAHSHSMVGLAWLRVFVIQE